MIRSDNCYGNLYVTSSEQPIIRLVSGVWYTNNQYYFLIGSTLFTSKEILVDWLRSQKDISETMEGFEPFIRDVVYCDGMLA